MTNNCSCTYVGHATNFVEAGGRTLVTDPHFGRTTLFIPRRVKLPVDPGRIPDPAAILISHTHFDHLHVASYKYFRSTVPIIVPEGCERAIGRFVTNPIVELSPFAEHELADGTKITAVPNAHRSGRVSQLRFTRSNAYLIRPAGAQATIFFCGDSAYGPHFGEIGDMARIDLAILPIGGYEPRFLLRCNHMTPAESVQAFEDLKASHMIPIHYGTFRLSMENIDAPMIWLRKIIEARPDLADKIHPLNPGEKFEM